MLAPVFRLHWFLVALALCWAPRSAEAYCILHTCRDVTPQDIAERPELELKECQTHDGCIVEGHALFYNSSCLSYGVSSRHVDLLGLTPEEFHDVVKAAFEVWESVDCGGGRPPGLSVQSVGVVEANGNFFCEDVPRANLSVWSLAVRWERPNDALGYTSSTHNTENGEVFDADVEFNLNKVRHEHAQEDWVTVLGRIAVHEAGHALGLAHSNNSDAVMYKSYSASELYTRVLSEDDILGICDLYPPNDDVSCSAPGYVEAALDESACQQAAQQASAAGAACALAPASRRDQSWAGWFALGLAGLMGGRRRAARSRVAVRSQMADTALD